MTSSEQNLSQRINSFKPTEYGLAEVSKSEIIALKNLYTSLRDNMFGNSALDPEQRKQLRDAITESVINDGWPQLSKLTEADLAETAVSHACVVAEKLHEERGVAALADTVWSYTTKNQFDRFVQKILVNNRQLEIGSPLEVDWNKAANRNLGNGKDITKYPDEVDSSKIHGIGKVERYWPAQLMKTLESLRLGKSNKTELEKLKVGNTPLEKYKIPWDNYTEVIKKAGTVEDISVGVAIKTLEILKERGLSSDQLISTLLAGYSPGGPTSEHGNIKEIGAIWGRIVTEVDTNEKLKDLRNDLRIAIEKRLTELKYY